MKLNDLTFIISVFFLPIWLVWEATVLWLGHKGVFGGAIEGSTRETVATISNVMKLRGYQLNVLPFFWSGMMAHWWFNWPEKWVWNVPYPAILFWLLVCGTLTADIMLWDTPFDELHSVLKFYRAPMVQCAVGFLAGFGLFPQAMARLAGWRWW